MNKIKKLRNSNVHHFDEIKRKKLKVKSIDTNCLSNEYSIHFEDLSNEILYEIFEFLDYLHVYHAFFDLNIRFRKLFTYSNLPIKINISSISKSTFQRYYRHILIPYQHRITSLCITNFLSFNLDISPHHILSTFIQLKTLILENITSNYLRNILKDISSLSNLTFLVIIPIDYVENANHLFRQIFRLPVLKYCKVSFENNHSEFDSLPFAINEYSPIEQLVIKHRIYINNLDRLLSYVPQLRRLSLDCLYGDHKNRLNHSIVLNNLTHLFIELIHFTFDEFELLIKTLFYTIQVLHLCVDDCQDYLDANRWKQLIVSSMPYLRIFDIQCSYRYVRNSTYQLRHEFRLNQFNTLFWFERQWYFTYQDYFKYGYHYIIFYSINPYRRKDYKFKQKSNKHNHLDDQNTNLTSVRHVHILDEEAIIDCINYFPNTTDLTLENISFQKTNSFINILKDMIPLQNLTKLVMESDHYSFEKLIELLSLTPNIATLKLQSIILNGKDHLTIQNSDTFRLVSNVNIIRSLTVKEICDIEKVELLFILCPRLQQFTIGDHWKYVKEIVKLLLSKTNENTRQLFSLCISNENKRLPDKLDTLIHGGKLLENYFIKSDYPKVYLWW